jgi:hypothetical protein
MIYGRADYVYLLYDSRYDWKASFGYGLLDGYSDKKRGTTDTVCVVFYIAFTLLMLLLGLFCYARGSSLQFNTPFDPDGRGCGVDYPDYKFIYFPSPQYDVSL